MNPCLDVRKPGIAGALGIADDAKCEKLCPSCPAKCEWRKRIESKIEEVGNVKLS